MYFAPATGVSLNRLMHLAGERNCQICTWHWWTKPEGTDLMLRAAMLSQAEIKAPPWPPQHMMAWLLHKLRHITSSPKKDRCCPSQDMLPWVRRQEKLVRYCESNCAWISCFMRQ